MTPLILGVTGAIATGKSLVCQTLVDLGAVHCDADKLVHRLYDPGTPGFERVVAAFGPDIVGTDGYIGDAIKAVIDEWRATLADEATAVMESVNHTESGYGAWCDQTWLVACDEDIARARLITR